jgi:hypothetical protein
MKDLRGSTCKFTLLHLPTGETFPFKNNLTGPYPVDTFTFSYKSWVADTLVKGSGEYVPYSDWVIKKFCEHKFIKGCIPQHLVVIWE